MATQNEVLTLAEAAAYLKISTRTLMRQILAGNIPAVKVGGQWRIRKRKLDEILNAEPKPKPGRKRRRKAENC
jgi:excisionase family DNA binding protein